jgi:hypothetical protein
MKTWSIAIISFILGALLTLSGVTYINDHTYPAPNFLNPEVTPRVHVPGKTESNIQLAITREIISQSCGYSSKWVIPSDTELSSQTYEITEVPTFVYITVPLRDGAKDLTVSYLRYYVEYGSGALYKAHFISCGLSADGYSQ